MTFTVASTNLASRVVAQTSGSTMSLSRHSPDRRCAKRDTTPPPALWQSSSSTSTKCRPCSPATPCWQPCTRGTLQAVDSSSKTPCSIPPCIFSGQTCTKTRPGYRPMEMLTRAAPRQHPLSMFSVGKNPAPSPQPTKPSRTRLYHGSEHSDITCCLAGSTRVIFPRCSPRLPCPPDKLRQCWENTRSKLPPKWATTPPGSVTCWTRKKLCPPRRCSHTWGRLGKERYLALWNACKGAHRLHRRCCLPFTQRTQTFAQRYAMDLWMASRCSSSPTVSLDRWLRSCWQILGQTSSRWNLTVGWIPLGYVVR
eukprot:m.87485 g.87485  ORF g.87485 m.87485 type:complete len:310 (+) comp16409_c0_seq2:753-1682(+)